MPDWLIFVFIVIMVVIMGLIGWYVDNRVCQCGHKSFDHVTLDDINIRCTKCKCKEFQEQK